MTTKTESLRWTPCLVMKSRKVANNTFEWTGTDGLRRIRLHKTDILTFTDEGIILNNGGWQTMTTKERMSEFLPAGYSVRQERGEWYVRLRTATGEWLEVPYYNGMVVKVYA